MGRLALRDPVPACLALLCLVSACAGPGGAPDASGVAASTELVLPGRDVQLRWDAEGALHLAYVGVESGGKADGPRIFYARVEDARGDGEGAFGEPPGAPSFGPVALSPPGVEVSAHGEVPPALEVLPDGTLVVAYPVSLPGKFKGEIRLQRSTDGGRTWSEARLLHDDGRGDGHRGGRGDDGGGDPGSHSFLSSTVNAAGEAVFAWLDNRDGEQGLRAARSADGRAVTANLTVDPVTCQCCATELLAGAGDELFLAYRDLAGDGARDVELASSPNGGAGFLEPVPVSADGWKVEACPHTGPRLALDRQGALWVAWFTGAEPGVWVASARDPSPRDAVRGAGPIFGPRQAVARMGGEVRSVAHPELAVLPDGRRLVLWEEGRKGEDGRLTRTLRARLSAGPETAAPWGEPSTLARDAVYPRVEVGPGDRAALAFTRLRTLTPGKDAVEGGTGGSRTASEVVVWDLPKLLDALAAG